MTFKLQLLIKQRTKSAPRRLHPADKSCMIAAIASQPSLYRCVSCYVCDVKQQRKQNRVCLNCRVYIFQYSCMPGGLSVGDSALYCCVPCLSSAIISLCLLILHKRSRPHSFSGHKLHVLLVYTAKTNKQTNKQNTHTRFGALLISDLR